MAVFQYTARTLKGDLVNDKIDLPTRDDVIAHLRKNRMVVVQVRAAPKEFKLNIKFGGGELDVELELFGRRADLHHDHAAPKELKPNIKFGSGVKTRHVVVFTR